MESETKQETRSAGFISERTSCYLYIFHSESELDATVQPSHSPRLDSCFAEVPLSAQPHTFNQCTGYHSQAQHDLFRYGVLPYSLSLQQGPRTCSGIVFVLVLFLLLLRIGLGLLGGWDGGSGCHSDGICWVRLQQRHDFGLALARENPPDE